MTHLEQKILSSFKNYRGLVTELIDALINNLMFVLHSVNLSLEDTLSLIESIEKHLTRD